MKFKGILHSLLLESRNTEKLIEKLQKLGVYEYNAKALAEVAGALTMFLAMKILEKYEAEYYDNAERAREIIKRNKIDIQNRMSLVNGSNSFVKERDKVRGIMDWVRVELDGNIRPFESLTFDQLYKESERWHESLGVGESKIDYNETNKIILDYRKDDAGFYWADLGSGNCPEEADRMGHCGRTRGNIYSLREFRKIQNNHTLNKSYLTASITNDGDLLQLKGPRNSKPTQEFYKYILPLFYYKLEDDGYLITGIGYEYDSKNDFKISDLTEEQIKKLYNDRPDIFKGRQEVKLLQSLGIIEKAAFNNVFELFISADNLEGYLRGDNASIAKDILMGNTYEFWDNWEYADWKYAVENEIDEKNTKEIKQKLSAKHPNADFRSMSLLDALNDFDEDQEIIHALKSAINDAEGQEYESYLYDSLKKALEDYGEVISMNDEGVTIKIDLETVIKNITIDDETLDEYYERCGDNDAECVYNELLGDGWIERARFDVDSRWYPSADVVNFNDILSDRLYDI
jgi:hypothetical protein